MKANELRIGNYLNYDGQNIIVKEIDQQGCVFMFNDGFEIWIDIFQTLPIPLTEEWLLRFGFERINHGYSMNDSSMNYHYELNNDNNFMLFFDGILFAVNESKIRHRHNFAHNKYVHQLQNLWYAVTGEELTLKTEQ